MVHGCANSKKQTFETAREPFRENVTARDRIVLSTGIYFLINSIYLILRVYTQFLFT